VIYPLLFLCTFVGFEAFEQSRWAFVNLLKKISPKLQWAVFALSTGSCLIIGSVPMNHSPFLYDAMSKLAKETPTPASFAYVANSHTGVSQFYLKAPSLQVPQHTIDDFMNGLRLGTRPPQDYFGLYRVELKDLEEIETRCQTVFQSSSGIYRRLISIFEKIPRKKRMDAIVKCSSLRVK
jgi:hypothetical protein